MMYSVTKRQNRSTEKRILSIRRRLSTEKKSMSMHWQEEFPSPAR